ncbi:pyridoxal phosphate-dependent aminotransferase [Haloarchaeobius sp. HME9146]|uniref:pyridoxal phosphate-dependent aminotransferase n=1 Tax=Haloarchaeobius sp. HME9146 TaxID=2978732 RepID=UPI0021C08CB5|nr:pyridoxal phosphate-dependent aminotransferase [Haloarchaeobius sp. HME9146]MCT9096821.1 pyridoxal phosphate-dependent aminotransferase [Haloarchaeobius sp. HME9146]
MFPTIEYLEWIAGRPDAATHDLGSSDLRGSFQHQRGPVPGRLAGLEDPPPDRGLETQLADLYEVDEANVLVTAGATTANFVAIATALQHTGPATEEPRPQVLVEKPGYEPLRATPQGLGGRVDRFLRPPEDGYPLDPHRVEAALTEDASLVITTNRHNPSGTVTPTETLAEAAQHAGEEGARLLVDEVYAPYVTEPTSEGAFGAPTAAGIENTVVTGSLTKFMGLGGLRVGWLIADEDFISQARSVAWHLPTLAEPSVALAGRALEHRAELVPVQRDLLRANHELLTSFVEEREDLTGSIPPGSPYGLVEHESVDGDELAARAWEEYDLLVVPGRFFDRPGAVRLSLGRSTAHCEDALAVLAELLDTLS